MLVHSVFRPCIVRLSTLCLYPLSMAAKDAVHAELLPRSVSAPWLPSSCSPSSKDALRPPPVPHASSSSRCANGMIGVVITDNRAPVVTHMVWYRIGAADEPTGKSGIAHFLEHLMFKATEKLRSGEFSKIVSRLGGNDNAFTEP